MRGYDRRFLEMDTSAKKVRRAPMKRVSSRTLVLCVYVTLLMAVTIYMKFM
jgi:hypothetical protein